MQAALQTFGYHTTHWQGYMIRYFDFVSHAFQGRISEPNLHQVFGDIPARGALLEERYWIVSSPFYLMI